MTHLVRVWRLVTSVALIAAFALAGVMLIPALLGYDRYVVLTGSMTGSIDAGSLIFDRVTPIADLEAGHVITYRPPANSGLEGLVTHRVTRISSGRDGRTVIRTKGDANEAADTWVYRPSGSSVARVAFDLPFVGHAYAALTERRNRTLVIGVPALAIALSVLGGLWRDAGREHAERSQAPQVTA